jgi:hypothetical protein
LPGSRNTLLPSGCNNRGMALASRS